MQNQLQLQSLLLRNSSYLQTLKTRFGGFFVAWNIARWQLGIWLSPRTVNPTMGLTMPWGTLMANLIGGMKSDAYVIN